jgi:hypothetical protein
MHQEYLIEFRCGGKEFAAQARDLRSISGGDWKPAQEDRRWVLAEMMGLKAGEGRRTLVVSLPEGACGFVVDAILKRPIERQPIADVPELLRDWLTVPVLSGVSLREGDTKVLHVLDLSGLAAWVRSRERVPAEERG